MAKLGLVTLVAMCAAAMSVDAGRVDLSHFASRMKRVAKKTGERLPFLKSAPASATTLCGLQGNAAFSVTFVSQEECNAWLGHSVLGGITGQTFSNCSQATVCSTYSQSVTGSFATAAVVGMSFWQLGSGEIAFDSNATAQGVYDVYTNSALGASINSNGNGLSFSGDCNDYTYSAFSLPFNTITAGMVSTFSLDSC